MYGYLDVTEVLPPNANGDGGDGDGSKTIEEHSGCGSHALRDAETDGVVEGNTVRAEVLSQDQQQDRGHILEEESEHEYDEDDRAVLDLDSRVHDVHHVRPRTTEVRTVLQYFRCCAQAVRN